MNRQILQEEQTQIDYILTSHHAKKAIILFHGYGANMQDLWPLYEMIEGYQDYDWIFPNGPEDLGRMIPGGRAWFHIDLQEMERAMALGLERKYADKYPQDFADVLVKMETFVRNIRKNYEEIILGGFSQGAMLATHLCLTKEIKVKALICFSGAPIGEKYLLDETTVNTHLPIFQSHGKSDSVLSFTEATRLHEVFKLGGHQVEFVAFNGMHEIPYQVTQKWSNFLKQLNH